MSPARRSHKRRDWPRGLREPRPGYYTWDHPDGRCMVIGRVPFPVARNEALVANQQVMLQRPSLMERLKGSTNTVAQLLEKMDVAENKNTARSVRSHDKKILAVLGAKAVAEVSVLDCAELVEGQASQGKGRSAQALRSRLMAAFARAVQLGWADANPATPTANPKAETKRGRLTLESFRAIHAVADQVAEWLPHAMMLALVTGQDRSTIASMERSHVADGYLTTWRTKTRKSNQPVAIPLALRMDCVGVSLAQLVTHRTGVVSRYLVHHVNPWGNAPAGSQVFVDRFSHAFTEARKLAGIPDEAAPTFHEIRSLAKRLYVAQGGVDTKALLGHATDRMGALYADPRGAEPIKVRIA